MSRASVESIRDFVQIQLDKIDAKRGCKTRASITLVGGYRRGKSESNDCDLLITYPEADGAEVGVLADLLGRLQAKGDFSRNPGRSNLALNTLLSSLGLVPEDGILSFSEEASRRLSGSNLPASALDSLDRGE